MLVAALGGSGGGEQSASDGADPFEALMSSDAVGGGAAGESASLIQPGAAERESFEQTMQSAEFVANPSALRQDPHSGVQPQPQPQVQASASERHVAAQTRQPGALAPPTRRGRRQNAPPTTAALAPTPALVPVSAVTPALQTQPPMPDLRTALHQFYWRVDRTKIANIDKMMSLFTPSQIKWQLQQKYGDYPPFLHATVAQPPPSM